MKSVPSSGFTLVEVIIVVSIISLLTAGLIPSFSNYTNRQTLNQAQEQIVSDLANVQNRALAGEQGEGVTGTTKYWGIRLTDGSLTYEVVANSSNNCTTAVLQRNEKLNGDLVIDVSAAGCVLFSTANGDRSGLDSVSVKEASSSTCRKVNINAAGLITKDTACP